MEIIEFVIFLSIVLFLFALALIKKGLLFSLLGLVITLFMMPSACFNLVVSRIYYYNSTSGTVESEVITANPNLMVIIFIILSVMFFVTITLRKGGEE